MNYYERACSLEPELIANRRHIHTNAEVGVHLPKTTEYVLGKLLEYHVDAHRCGEGITATIGSGNPVIMLRADMDALPMPEQSGLDFACPTGTEAHCCGHDLHASMLLTAAKMLKENESELKGTVKLMFQTGEEVFLGASNMIEHGLLEDPVPDAALAFHVGAGQIPLGLYMYNDTGKATMFSVDIFKIHVLGKGAHGAYPHNSIDPINIAVHIYLALQELIARESDPNKACVLTVGQFVAGSAPNIIPEEVYLSGTIRTNDNDARELLLRRMKEVSEGVAATYGGRIEMEPVTGVPPLICNPDLTREMVGYLNQLPVPGLTAYPGITASASEDFAVIAEKIPSTFMYLSAGFLDERGKASAHNPKVMFNEGVLPFGASALAHCATEWLKNHHE